MKVVKGGIFSKEYDFKNGPPPGIQTACNHCGAIIETEGKDENIEIKIITCRRSRCKNLVWAAKCPEYNKIIHFPVDMSNRLFLRINRFGR